jgi:pyruvate dehydrogenase E2 component (dihydrolipoamide acetyltransferase)
MATPIEMPKLGNTVEECLLARWNKRPGDLVAEGELLAEIETDKATFELTAPVAGTLLAAFFKEGDLVPVFANVCVVGAPGESIEAFQPKQAQAAPAPTHIEDKSRQTEARPIQPSAEVFYTPRARRFAEEHSFYPETVLGSGPGGRVLEEDLQRLYRESPRPTSLARKLMDAGHELRGEGSGPNRRVRASDLGPPPARVSSIREKTARRMRESLGTTAQYTMSTSAEAVGLLTLRSEIKAHGPNKGLPDINLNEMVMFCAVKALLLTPEVNVEFTGGKIYPHAAINIGFACDTPKGLLVPVVKDAQKLTLPELALRIKTLTRQATEGAISPEDLGGGTFTVSNLGIFGVESFTPILNPPQVAILGVNTIELKPVRKNGGIEFLEHIGLSLTCDHQVIDGAPGARFLKIVREQIEAIKSIAALEI